ncbi:pancreatic lipase-related protein 3-like isoform X2 [Bombus fervidus]|uniref:pancreatic lipase-related protein 3-like isoform X2 n=1 Tax=Bombus fervidus TaxID=203811 RepID=UPI003AB13A41
MTKLSSYIFFILLNILVAGADDNGTNDVNTIFIRLFKRDGSYLDANVLNKTELVILGRHLQKNKNTAFFIHGYTESINSNDVIVVTNGLDPAGPLFYILNQRLTSEDADFVDIIHTDAGFYGITLHSGHVDFYPNGGHRPQPGCTLINIPLSAADFCSHQRSYLFYSESVRNHRAFIGKCQENCTSDLVPMGFITPRNTRGVYSLTTNAESPFGKGTKGV